MELRDFFQKYPKTAVALSGGVDSAYLLYAAKKYGTEAKAYFVQTAFQPAFEREDAQRLCGEFGVTLRVLEVELLSDPGIAANPPDRCYRCKKKMFAAIAKAAEEDGFSILLDGTNATDPASDRPGMQALRELSVRSPLRECGLTKEEIRRYSKEAGLFTWDKPAYACLATRIPTGIELTAEKLERTEAAEVYLASLGFADFRIRLLGTAGRVQLRPEQFPRLLERRQEVLAGLKRWYSDVFLDLEGRP